MVPYVLLLCQVVLAATLLFAATGKILRSEQFLAALRLSHLPEGLVVPIAMLTPALEMCLAIALLVNTKGSLSFIMAATAGLWAIFTVWMVVVSARGMRLTCGCFGTGRAEVGIRTIVRNALLIGVSLGGLALALHTRALLPAPSLWMGDAVVTLSLCLILLQALWHGRSGMVLSWDRLPVRDAQEPLPAQSSLDR